MLTFAFNTMCLLDSISNDGRKKMCYSGVPQLSGALFLIVNCER